MEDRYLFIALVIIHGGFIGYLLMAQRNIYDILRKMNKKINDFKE
jgi:hypothetical protein